MASKDRKTTEDETFDDLGDLLGPSHDEQHTGDPFADAGEEAAPDPGGSAPEDEGEDQEPEARVHHAREEWPQESASGAARPHEDRVVRAAGVLFLLVGITTAALSFVPEHFRPAGFAGASALLPTPILFVVAGLVLGQFASLRRRTEQSNERIAELARALQRTHTTARSTRRNVRRILGNMKAQLERPPASGEELSRVLGFMQKQDEKLVNLNHATKMYGKAFVDLSGKLAELRKSSETTRETLERHGESLLPGMENLLGEATQRIATQVTGHLDSRLDGKDSVSKEEVGALLEQSRANLLQKTSEHLERELAGLKGLLLESRTDLAQRIQAAVTETTRAGGDEVAGILLQCESIQKAVASLESHVDATLGRQAPLSREDVGSLLDQSGSAILQKTTAHLEQELAGLRDLLRESREDVAARIGSLAAAVPVGPAAAASGARADIAPHGEQPATAGAAEAATPRSREEPAAPAQQPGARPGAPSRSAVTGAIAKLRKLRGS